MFSTYCVTPPSEWELRNELPLPVEMSKQNALCREIETWTNGKTEQIVTHILGYMSVSDRKEAGLVSRSWYQASLDPIVLKDSLTSISMDDSSSEHGRNHPMQQRKIQHLAIENVHRLNEASLPGAAILSSIESLSLKGSQLTDGDFVRLLTGCHSLQSLDLTSCNSLFMSGLVLSNKQDMCCMKEVLSGIKELNLSGIRYISDVTFNRFANACPKLEHLDISGNQITFHSTNISNDLSGKGNSVFLTYDNLLAFLAESHCQVSVLNLSRTSIDNKALSKLVQTCGKTLLELSLVGCQEIDLGGIENLREASLRRLDISKCQKVRGLAIAEICDHMGTLTDLSLSQCVQVCSRSIAKLSSLCGLRKLDLSCIPSVTSEVLIEGICGSKRAGLTHLNLNCCASVGDTFMLAASARLNSLTHLDLGSTKVSDKSLLLISKNMRELQSLRLAWCKAITDSGLLGELGVDVSHLDEILDKDQHTIIFQKPSQFRDKSQHLHDLEQDIIQEMGGRAYPICYLRKLRHLDLTSCLRVTDVSIGKVMVFPELQTLRLDLCTEVTDTSAEFIAAHVPSLEVLSLSGCSITDRGVSAVTARLHRLKALDISKCRLLTDQSVGAIRHNCKRLRTLDVSFCCGISTEAIQTLESILHSLKHVKKRLTGNAVNS